MSSFRPAVTLWGRRLILACTAAVALGYLPYRVAAAPSSARIRALEDELTRTRASIDELERSNAERRKVIDALKHDRDAIEEIARDELGMVRPGELILRVEPAAPEGRAAPARETR